MINSLIFPNKGFISPLKFLSSSNKPLFTIVALNKVHSTAFLSYLKSKYESSNSISTIIFLAFFIGAEISFLLISSLLIIGEL